jgi:hypothetical protein
MHGSYQSPSLTLLSCTFLPLRLGRWCLEINAHENVGLGLHILLLDRFSVNAQYQSPSYPLFSYTFLPLRLGRWCLWCLEINAHEDVGLGLHILLLDRFSVNAQYQSPSYPLHFVSPISLHLFSYFGCCLFGVGNSYKKEMISG